MDVVDARGEVVGFDRGLGATLLLDRPVIPLTYKDVDHKGHDRPHGHQPSELQVAVESAAEEG